MESEDIYRWSRDRLSEYRSNSFGNFQGRIIAFAKAMDIGDVTLADEQRRFALLEPHPGVFHWIIHWATIGDPDQRLAAACRDAIAAHPSIKQWIP